MPFPLLVVVRLAVVVPPLGPVTDPDSMVPVRVLVMLPCPLAVLPPAPVAVPLRETLTPFLSDGPGCGTSVAAGHRFVRRPVKALRTEQLPSTLCSY